MAINGIYKIGNPDGSWSDITYSQLIVDSRWQILDSEFARRIMGMIDAAKAAGKTVHIGWTYRTDSHQRNEFLSRYAGSVKVPTDQDKSIPGYYVYWDGVDGTGRRWTHWYKKSGKTTIAPPGQSYHGLVTKQQKCLGVDLLWLDPTVKTHLTNIHELYGVEMSTDPSDPYHFQPKEVPVSRKNYNPSSHSLSYYDFSSAPLLTASGTNMLPAAPLYYNSLSNSSAEVYKLQSAMKQWGWYTGILRPDYDINTFTAVKRMQTALKINASGTYDAATRTAYSNFLISMAYYR